MSSVQPAVHLVSSLVMEHPFGLSSAEAQATELRVMLLLTSVSQVKQLPLPDETYRNCFSCLLKRKVCPHGRWDWCAVPPQGFWRWVLAAALT